ncbi:hypothetical protein H0H92_008190, partial [Tricholoma furcatifolium]
MCSTDNALLKDIVEKWKYTLCAQKYITANDSLTGANVSEAANVVFARIGESNEFAWNVSYEIGATQHSFTEGNAVQKLDTSVLPINNVQTAELGNTWTDFKVNEAKDTPKNGFRFWADFSPVQPSVVVYMSGVKGQDKGVPSFISPTTYPTNAMIIILIEQVRVFFSGGTITSETMTTKPTAYPLVIDLTEEK